MGFDELFFQLTYWREALVDAGFSVSTGIADISLIVPTAEGILCIVIVHIVSVASWTFFHNFVPFGK